MNDPRAQEALDELDVVPPTPAELGRVVSRDVAVYTVGTVVANAVLYLAVPIYTRAFEPAEYSKFAFVTTVSGVLSGLLVLGGDTALARFWFQDARAAARRSLSLTWVGFLAAWAVVLSVLMAPLAGPVASFTLGDRRDADLFLLALVTLPVAQTSRMLAQVMRNQFRAVPFVVTGVLLGVANLCFGLFFALALGLGIAGIFLGILTAETVVLVVRTVMTRDAFDLPFDRDLLRSLLRFGVPLVPVTVSYWVFTAADRIVVGKVAGLTELGYYSVAVTVTLIFTVLSSAISQAWLPRALQLYQHDPDRAAVAVGTSLTYLVVGLGVLATGLAALAPEVAAVLGGPEYAPAARAIPLLCMGSVAYGTASITASGMTMTHRTGRLAGLAVGAAVVNVVAALALVPPFGMLGAAGAALVGYVVLTTAYLTTSQRLWAIRIEWRRLTVVVGLLALVTVTTTERQGDPLIVRLAVPVLFIMLVPLLARIRNDERRLLAGALGRLRH